MTGSLTDADDLTQEVFLRAWRNLDGFERRSSHRTWLYRICTNACLDFLKSHERRSRPTHSIEETLECETWIDPYPSPTDPAETVVADATTDLYLTAALVQLPPRQRAAFIARELLDLDAAATAAILDCTVTAANSLRQRAAARIRELAPHLDELTEPVEDHALIRGYVEAHRHNDTDSIVALLDADVRISMPPEPPCIGIGAAASFFDHILGRRRPGDWLLKQTRANGRPATANYLRRPTDTTHRALSIDVLRTDADRHITAIHCFLGDRRFPSFGLDLTTSTR